VCGVDRNNDCGENDDDGEDVIISHITKKRRRKKKKHPSSNILTLFSLCVSLYIVLSVFSSPCISVSAKPTQIMDKLRACYIFNPEWGSEFDEEKKIVYFYPPDTELDVQKNYIGLAEALVNFTLDFSPNYPCEAVHCAESRYAFFPIEDEFWIVLVVETAAEQLQDLTADESAPGDLDDASMYAILKRCYKMFQLLHGSFSSYVIEEKHDPASKKKRGPRLPQTDALVSLIQRYMTFFLGTIRFNNVRYFMDLDGLQFLPVDKISFLSVQYVVSTIRSEFPCVQGMALLYDRDLLWSDLGQEDMLLLYTLHQDYMRRFLTYSSDHQLATTAAAQNTNSTSSISQKAKTSSAFLTAPWIPSSLPPQVHLHRPLHVRDRSINSNKTDAPVDSKSNSDNIKLLQSGRLAVYRRGHMTLLLLLDDSHAHDSDIPDWQTESFYMRFEQIMDADLHKLDQQLRQQTKQRAEQEEQFRFLYFNHMNLAFKTSLRKRDSHGSGAADRKSSSPSSSQNSLSPIANPMALAGHASPMMAQRSPLSGVLTDAVNTANTTGSDAASSASSSGAHAGSTSLSMDTIRIMRSIHNDFAKQAKIEERAEDYKLRVVAPIRAPTANGSTNGQSDASNTASVDPAAGTGTAFHSNAPDKSVAEQLSVFEAQQRRSAVPSEVCVQLNDECWVVGRRADGSCREFFLLIEDKVSDLSAVQGEVDVLARTYFHNVFIH
jgi:vacuolar fusion protein CCZ1, animal type